MRPELVRLLEVVRERNSSQQQPQIPSPPASAIQQEIMVECEKNEKREKLEGKGRGGKLFMCYK